MTGARKLSIGTSLAVAALAVPTVAIAASSGHRMVSPSVKAKGKHQVFPLLGADCFEGRISLRNKFYRKWPAMFCLIGPSSNANIAEFKAAAKATSYKACYNGKHCYRLRVDKKFHPSPFNLLLPEKGRTGYWSAKKTKGEVFYVGGFYVRAHQKSFPNKYQLDVYITYDKHRYEVILQNTGGWGRAPYNDANETSKQIAVKELK
jgi:hypothetical protein